MSTHDSDAIWDEDDGDWCDHPEAAVISDVNGDHFCSTCSAEWVASPTGGTDDD